MLIPDAGPPSWFVAVACLIGLLVVASIVVAVYRAGRMASRGQNPLTLREDLAWQASNSAALKPVRSKADRLAELDRLHDSGTISDVEHAEARARIIAE